jgi:DNA-directed RNA polymerase subunit N
MIIPVRCFTCNKVIASKWTVHRRNLRDGMSMKASLDNIGFTRFCCRSMFISHVPMMERMLTHKQAVEEDSKKRLPT